MVVAVVDCEPNVLAEVAEAAAEVVDMAVIVAGSSQAVREDLIGGVGRMSDVLPAVVLVGVVAAVGVLVQSYTVVVQAYPC